MALTAGAVACGDSTTESTAPRMPGAIALTVQTSGFMQDDSYELLVDGASQGTVAADGEATISDLDPATYEVGLGDVAENCSVEATSVEVASDETASVALTVMCAAPAPTTYTVRFSRARPDLDTGEITECPFGICSTTEAWDLYVYNNSGTTPHSVIRQNQSTSVEIAHVTGTSLAELTEEDYMGATFTTELVADPFDSGRVILIRTDLGAVYALGNPVEDTVAGTLTFDAALIVAP